jgi:hypothetical protein
LNADTIFSDAVCVELPVQYQGVRFNADLVKTDLGDYYPRFLDSLYRDISTRKYRDKNTLICSPAGHSKTILAYGCLQTLFRMKIPVVTLHDILEIRRLAAEYESGKSDGAVYTVPYLFVKIPLELNFQVFSALAALIDRRVRRGNSTIAIYNGSWSWLLKFDNGGVLASMKDDGSFMSLDVKNFQPKREESDGEPT